LGGVIAFIVTSILTIEQLHAGNQQTKITNTLMFLNNMQTSEFHANYLDSLSWLEDSILKPQSQETPPLLIERKIGYVLNWYSNLWILYRKEVLDKDTIDTTVGIQIAQFWLLTNCVLKPEQLRGYENINLFHSELEKCAAVKTSKSYKDLKEKLQCQRQ
jgi:hypothetical protein